MPNKTKQNTKKQYRTNMLATTIQITNNPPHTPTPTTTAGWLRGQPPQQVADAHTVLNVNPTVCSLAKTFLCPTQNTHPHPPPTIGWSTHAGTRKQPNTTQTAMLHCSPQTGLPRKEVIQPHLPVRLPCYDFVPIANPTFDHSPRKSG